MDIGIPAALTVSAVTAELATIATRRDPDPGDADPRMRSWNDRWQLLRVGGAVIPAEQSVVEAGIRDGDVLILSRSPVAATPILFDDVVDAMAQVSASRFRDWTPQSAAAVGYFLCATAVVLTLVLGGILHSPTGSMTVGAMCGLGCMAALLAAWVLRHRNEAVLLCRVLGVSATALAATAAVAITPGQFGTPHIVFAAAVTTLMCAITARWAHAAPQQTAAIGTAVLAAVTTTLIAAVWTPPHACALGAALGVLIISWAPRIATTLARVPVPPVPTAGEPVDPVDNDPQPAVEGIGAIGAVSIPSAAALDQRAVRANQLLTGIVCAAGLFTTAMAVSTALLWTAPHSAPAAAPTLFAAVIAAALSLRARSYGHVIPAGWLMVCGAGAALATVVGFAVRGCLPTTWATALLIVGGAVALVCGYAVPRGDYSPPVRRSVEIAEYTLLAAVVPLLCWVAQIYPAVRDIW